MITEINESKLLTQDISWECKCRFDGKKCNSDQWCNKNNNNADVSVKSIMCVEKIIFGIENLKMENS